MRRTRRQVNLLNGAAVVIALGLSLALTARQRPGPQVAAPGDSSSPRQLVDDTGTTVAVAPYQRIISGSILTDRLLQEICEPERVIAMTGHTMRKQSLAYRFPRRTVLEDLTDAEQLLALGPDLLVVNGFGDIRRVERLRGAGLTVFDLGHMQGLSSFQEDIEQLSTLIGEPERGRRYASTFLGRLRAVAIDIPQEHRREALYVNLHGNQLFGGARGTAHHDILDHAGLVDVASRHYEGWPAYNAEQLLALNPPLIITARGVGQRLCRHAGLSLLQACRNADGVVEIEPELLGDPGVGMVDAAEAIRQAVYGPRPRP